MLRFGKYILFIFLLSSIGCEEPVDLDFPIAKSKIAITSEFAPGRPFEVFISNSVSSISNSSTQRLINAEVTINEEDKAFELLQLIREIDGRKVIPFFKSRSNVSSRKREYHIEVEVPGYTTATATDIIPEAASFGSFELLNHVEKDRDGEKEITFEFNVNFEPNAINDYYHLIVYYETLNAYPDGTRDKRSKRLILEDMDGNPKFLRHFSKGILMRTSDFDGPIASFNLKSGVQPSRFTIDHQLVAELRTVSDDYYLFHSSYTRQRSQKDSIVGQAIVLHNNIQNGLGTFAAYNYVRDSIRLDK